METYCVTRDGGVLAICTYTCVYSEGVYVVRVCMWEGVTSNDVYLYY